MGERSLSETDIHDMGVNRKIPKNERRKDDRRKSINSYVDPKFERREGDRRMLVCGDCKLIQDCNIQKMSTPACKRATLWKKA